MRSPSTSPCALKAFVPRLAPRTGRLLGCALGVALALTGSRVQAIEETLPPPDTDTRIRTAWYSDGSCLLRIGEHSLIGVTGIDADMAPEGARTKVHCDVESGQRMTMLMRGDGLAIGERVVLASPSEIEDNPNGSVAWLALLEDDVSPENTPRRFVIDGRILIRETPAVSAAGMALNADKLPFAEIDGRLEPLRRHPDPQDPGVPAASVDPDGVTRMACRVRPCEPAEPPAEPVEPVEKDN